MTDELANPSRRQFFHTLVATAPQRFARVASIGATTTGVLWAVHGTDPNNIFVAGDDGLIFHFDGDAWQREPLGTDLPIHALTSMDDETVVAIGWLGLICERTDDQWRYIQGGHNTRDSKDPDEIRLNLPLFDVAAAPNGDVWAVGDGGRVVRRTDGVWTEFDCPTQANLRCVLPLADGSILVGGVGGAVLRRVEGEWVVIETNTRSQILSMAARGDDDIIAVGGEYIGSSAGFVGRIFSTDCESWTQIDIDQPLPRLRRVRCDGPGGLLIVGDGGIALRIDDGELAALETRLRHDLHDVAGFAGHTPVLCGDAGVVLTAAPPLATVKGDTEAVPRSSRSPQWSIAAESDSPHILRGLWAASDDCVFAVGDAGTALRYNENAWSRLPVPENIRLHAVWGTSPTNVYACGDQSTILHFDGEQWTTAYSGELDVALLAITGFGPHDIFVVGDHGMALRYDGLQWQRLETGTRYELYGVWGQDGDHVLAVGGGGVIVRWNGTEWGTFSAGVREDLFGVWGESLERIYIAGLSGTVIEFSGSTFDKKFSSVRNDLQALAGRPGGPVFSVGSNGVVLRHDGSDWDVEDSGTKATLNAVAIADNAVYAVGGGQLLRRAL